MDITVVICTHNRADLLEKMLDVLSHAVYPVNLVCEILVIANACRDNTSTVLDHFVGVFRTGSRPTLRWLVEPVPGKSVALNIAIRESSGDVLCFIDDDQYVAEDFFPALRDALARYPEHEILCGNMVPDWDGSEPSWVHEKGQFHIGIRPFPEYDLGDTPMEIAGELKLPSGGNIIVRKPVFARAGVFSTDLGPQGHNLMGGEDIEFVKRALRQGAHIMYVPAIRQKHAVEHSRMSTPYMMRKSYLRSLSNVMLQQTPGHIRPYMFWKLGKFALLALASFNGSRRFYYLIRLAATYGELRGNFARQSNSK